MSATGRDEAALGTQVVMEGIVCPGQSALKVPNVHHLGVFDGAGVLLPQTIDDRHHGTHLYRSPDLSLYDEISESADAEVIYAGVFFDHFGHFLLESLARLWYAKDRPELPIIWIGVDSWKTSPPLRTWQTDILRVLGVRNPVRILTEPTRFKKLHVPDAGYKYGDWFHPQHADFLAAYGGVDQIPNKRIWLSRGNVDTGIGIVNGASVESSLAREGWEIVQPERLPIEQQLRLFAEAEEIAGEEGSAFHTLVLLRDVTNKKFHVFKRHGPEHMSFHTIGNIRGVNQSFHSGGADVVFANGGRDVQRLMPNSDSVLTSLRVPVRSRPRVARGDDASVRRITRLIKRVQAKSYLEVGVRDGAVFNAIECERKVGVGLDIRFDTRSLASQSTKLYSLSVNDYSTYFAARERFDVIFLNGFHHHEDVLNTFGALLPLAHERTVFLIDNVLPIDEFSALRNQSEALARRHATGNLRKAWHGDVFVAIFLMQKMFPEWEVATITTGGNAQALLHSRRHDLRYSPVHAGARFVSRGEDADMCLSYQQLLERRQEMNPMSEDAALETVRSLAS